MKRWPTKLLGELVDFVGGGTPRRDRPDYWGGEIPWASVKDLQSQSLETTLESITADGLANSASNLIPKGTVIIASRVGLGKVAINRKPVAINQDLKALTPRSNDLLPRYLLFFLLLKADYFERTGVGATVKGLTLADYQKLNIVLPPVAAQERIVKLLDEADELRKLRAQADRRTTELIPALFNEMFGDQGEFPTATVAELAEQREGSIRTGPFGSDLHHSEFVEEGIPVLGIDNVVENEFRWTKSRCVTPAKFEEMRRFVVFAGDVLVTIMGTVGRCVVAPTDLPVCISTKHLCTVTVNRKRVEPRYLWGSFLFDESVRRQTRTVGKGAIMEGWNSTIIKQLTVRVPPLALQKEFAARVEEIRAMQAGQAASRRRLNDLFQSTLHRAFRGEL